MGSRHGRNPYLFTLKTNNTVYHCGERDDFDENGTLIPANPKSGKGTRIAIAWAEDIKSAYQPVSASQPDAMMQQQPKPPSPEPDEDVEQRKRIQAQDEAAEKVRNLLFFHVQGSQLPGKSRSFISNSVQSFTEYRQ